MAGLWNALWTRKPGDDPLVLRHEAIRIGKAVSLTLKDAQWSGAGGVGLNAFQRIFRAGAQTPMGI